MQRSSRVMAMPKFGTARRFGRAAPRFVVKREQDIRQKHGQREYAAENCLLEDVDDSAESAWEAERHASFGAKLNRIFELAIVGMLGGAGLGSVAGTNGTLIGLIVGGVFCVCNESMACFGRSR